MARHLGFVSPLFLCILLSCSSSQKLANWEFTGGPYAQNISTIFIDPQNNSHLLAGLTNGDVYSSLNEGLTWEKLSTISLGRIVYRFFQHPDDGKRLFATTGSGLFLSTDAGENWNEIPIDAASTAKSARSFAIEPYNTRVMYVGIAGQGISKSTDGGSSWSPCNGGLDSVALSKCEVCDIKIDPSKPDVLYAAVRGIGVIKSTDGGVSWIKLTSIIGTGGIAPTSIVVNSKLPTTLCFGMEAGSIYKSVDGGQTWSPTRFGSGTNKPVNLEVHPSNPQTLYAGTEDDVLVSSDFGTTWKSIANELPHVAATIAVGLGGPYPIVYAFGEGIGVDRTTDNGSSWRPIETQLGGSTVSWLAGDRGDDLVYAVVGGSVHQWNTRSRQWKSASNKLAGGTVSSITVDTDSSSIVYVASELGIFGTKNGGAIWSAGSMQMRGRRVSIIATHPILKTRILCVSGGELFASTDRGETWGQTKPLNERCEVRSFAFSNTDAGVVLGATAASGVVVSTNGGLDWEGSRYGLEGSDLVAVTLDDKDKNTLYAWSEKGGGFRSTNKGLVWDHYSSPWPAGQRVEIVSDKYTPSEVVALVGMNQLYYSRSGGATWFSVPIPPVPGDIVSSYWNSVTSTLYAGIGEVGVYRISIGEYLKQLFGE